jgi:hypothetical protein
MVGISKLFSDCGKSGHRVGVSSISSLDCGGQVSILSLRRAYLIEHQSTLVVILDPKGCRFGLN